MKRLSLVATGGCAATLALCAAAALSTSPGAPPAASADARAVGPAAPRPWIPSWVAGLADRIATESGDPSPASIDALRAHGFYRVVMTGRFTAWGAFLPNARAVPSGTVVSFTVDASSRRVVSYSIGDSEPAIFRLGRRTPLTLR